MPESSRVVIKITGESGQGVNSIGEIVAKALKRAGYYTFGYREYPSLIKGGHAFHQIDFSDIPLNAPSRYTDIMLSFSRVSFHEYLPTLKNGGQAIHMLPMLELTEDEKGQLTQKQIKVSYLPAEEIAEAAGGKSIMANVVMVGVLWKLLGMPPEPMEEMIKREFSHKQEVIKPNLECFNGGYNKIPEGLSVASLRFSPNHERKDDAQLTGNHLVALGAMAAGVRAYFAYPMTPSSSILSYMANTYHETGILVKQLDDEISVAQAAIGSMFMGTRALVATSGGGFDLMTESVSLSGITETPFVCVLAQRPGPATGLPTWTNASDLNLAIYAGHGEFPRCVIAASDAKSAYTTIQNAFNIAEKYQIPTIVLTDKQIAESLFQIDDVPKDINIERHLLSSKDAQKAASSDRFKITDSGISPRWLPGQSEQTYVANSDEHTEDGTVTEDSKASKAMNQKRLKKLQTLREELPEPVLSGPLKASITFITWGSVKNTLDDVMHAWNKKFPHKPFNYLNYEYVYPLKLEKFKELTEGSSDIVLIENNEFCQLGAQITMQTGYRFKEKLTKSDGRPFFIEDVMDYLKDRLKV